MHFFELMKNRFQDFLRKSLNLSKSNVNNTFGKTNLDNGLFSLLSEDLLFSISVAAAEIMGGREVHVEAGSTLNLTCVVRNSREKPHYLLWYHRNEVRDTEIRILIHLRSTVNYSVFPCFINSADNH